MIIVDAHCDTITRIMETKSNLYENGCHIDIKRLKNIGSYVQFFAAFISPDYCQAYSMKRAVQIIEKFYEQIELYNDSIMLCRNYKEIEESIGNNKIAAILSIEGGDALQGDISALRIFYRLGVRSIGLTWNHRNEIADGVSDSDTGGGLTPFGRSVIKEMNSLGMILDLSHISEKGFWDVMKLTASPVIVSHSNAMKICNNKRNLTDEQIMAVKKNDGVVGINLYPRFLTDSGKAGIKDIISHIEHILALAGEDHIGMGADFDGVECLPEGMAGVQDIESMLNELQRLNYSQSTIEKIAGRNFLRVIKKVC